MKRDILFSIAIVACALLLNLKTIAQVAINTDGAAPNSSAMLDVKSTDKGILIPRVAGTSSITSPATGLLIYNTDDDSFYYYDGGGWVKLGSQWSQTTGGIYYSNRAAIGGSSIDASAAFDIQSEDRGVLIPRITENAKNALASPAMGLLIYQTDGTPGFHYYNGTEWKSVAGLISLDVTAPLTSTGGSAPSIGLTTPLTVGNGGTGATTFNNSSVLLGAGTGAITTSSTFVKTSTGVGVSTSSPNSALHVNGSFALAYVSKSSNYTAGANDQCIAASGSSTTITLPTASGITGRVYTIKCIGSSSVTVGTTSSQTIDGSTTYNLSAQYKYVTVISNGSNWLIISNN